MDGHLQALQHGHVGIGGGAGQTQQGVLADVPRGDVRHARRIGCAVDQEPGRVAVDGGGQSARGDGRVEGRVDVAVEQLHRVRIGHARVNLAGCNILGHQAAQAHVDLLLGEGAAVVEQGAVPVHGGPRIVARCAGGNLGAEGADPRVRSRPSARSAAVPGRGAASWQGLPRDDDGGRLRQLVAQVDGQRPIRHIQGGPGDLCRSPRNCWRNWRRPRRTPRSEQLRRMRCH